jgi:arylsulfatase A-like enzyme
MGSQRITRRDFLNALKLAGMLLPASGLIDLFGQSVRGPNQAGGPNFIVLLFDTLTARHMSLHGYERNTTPNIDKFAKRSTVFHQHQAASSHTKPSTASLLTGVYPWSHRALNFYTTLMDAYGTANLFGMLPGYYSMAYTHNTYAATILSQMESGINDLKPVEELMIYDPNRLPNIFRNDYPMGFYAAKRWKDNYMGPSNSLFLNPVFTVSESVSAERAVRDYRQTFPLGLNHNQEGYQYVLEDAIDWIAQSSATVQSPFLGYFHLLPPHEAYTPRVDFVGNFAEDGHRLVEKAPHYFSDRVSQPELEGFSQRYDEYIGYVDSEFSRLIGELEMLGVLDTTYLILTSDHGQMFERGIHGHNSPTLYESLIHVPLLVHAPGQTRGMDIHSPTSITDILPTILHLAGQNLPERLEGRPLPSLGGIEDHERVIFSMDGKENHKMKPLTAATFSATRWPYKLINYQGYRGYDNIDELYDLENDPEEINNLAGSSPAIVSEMRQELAKARSVAELASIGATVNQ